MLCLMTAGGSKVALLESTTLLTSLVRGYAQYVMYFSARSEKWEVSGYRDVELF